MDEINASNTEHTEGFVFAGGRGSDRSKEEKIENKMPDPGSQICPLSSIGSRQKRSLDSATGTLKYMAPDFDAPLDEFSDYT